MTSDETDEVLGTIDNAITVAGDDHAPLDVRLAAVAQVADIADGLMARLMKVTS